MNPAQPIETKTHGLECPSPSELSQWLEQSGSPHDPVAKHIEHCRKCCLTLDRLTHSTVVDSLVQTVSQRPIGLSFLNPPLRARDLGTLDHYAVERQLDGGGMGVVFRAWDTRLERLVAIKLMRMFDSSTAIERFRREARAAAKLVHDHIVPIYSVAETSDGRPYLVMPLIVGESLRQVISRISIPPRDAAQWIRQIALGLHVAHEAGLIHRDIKPANILLDDQDGRAKLTDFGLVQEADRPALTQTDGILGTPEFMSPEQIRNQMLDGRSDVYSLGMTLYQCLTGFTPFRGQTFEVLQQQQDQMPLAPSVIHPDIPRDLETICLKAIRKEPASRYETAQALADDLTRFLNGEPIQARPVSRRERTQAWIRRHPWQALSASLAAIVFLGTAIGAFMLARSYESERQTSQALEQMRDEADQSFQLTRNQLTAVVNRLKDDLLQVPQAEQAAIQSIRDVANLYAELNQIRPDDQPVAEEYLASLKDEWYSEWLYDGDTLERQALERFQTESVRLLERFPNSTAIASLRAELLLDLAIESENAGDRMQADQFQQEGREMLTQLMAAEPNSLPVRTLVWKAAWQEYQTANQRNAPVEQIVKLAHNLVEAQLSVIELTPADKRTEAICIGIDQISRLVEAQIEAKQMPEAALALEHAAQLLAVLSETSAITLEVRQAQVRILLAELQLAKAKQNQELRALKIEQLITANRSILQDFPEGEMPMKSLVRALFEKVEYRQEQGDERLTAEIAEIESLLKQIEANPAVAAWAGTYRDKLKDLQTQLAD